MMHGAKLFNVEYDDISLETYHHCLAHLIICNPPLPICYMDSCQYCPGTNDLKDCSLATFDENMIDEVVYKQWVSVDRSTLETVCSISEDFVETFCEKLQVLLSHSFTAT